MRLQAGQQWLWCRQGTVWLTVPGDLHDYFLQAGESLEIGGAAVVVSALGTRAVAEVCA